MNFEKTEFLNLLKIGSLAVISIFVLNACAKIVSPTGGNKDETPPEITAASKKFPATNFTDKEIIFEFDEYINVTDLSKIKISPREEEQAEIKVRGKKLIVELPEDLNEKLTYTIDFADAIKDFNENNSIESFSLIFTAKEKIDSASVSGFIKTAFNHSAPKKTKVGLYEVEDSLNLDSLAFQKKSLYFANVDENSGEFKINGISPGEYFVVAIKDENDDDLLSPTEELAFLSKPISVLDSSRIENLDLFIFPSIKKEYKVLNTEDVSRETFKIEFNEIVENLEINVLQENEEDEIWVKTGKQKENWVNIFHQIEDSIQIEISNRVGAESAVIDTIWIKKDTSLYEQNILPLENFEEQKQQAFFENYELAFMIPAKSLDKDKILLEQEIDSLYKAVELPMKIENGKLQIENEWQADEKYKLSILPDGVTGINNTSLIDTLTQQFEIKGMDRYGNLTLIAGDSLINSGSYLFELLKKDALIEKGKLASTNNIEMLEGADYDLIIIKDDNENQQWDSGNILENKQPETTYIFKKINVKENWDISVKLKF